MSEFIRLAIARARLWWLFMRNTDAGPVRAWMFVMWQGRDRFKDAPVRAAETEQAWDDANDARSAALMDAADEARMEAGQE